MEHVIEAISQVWWGFTWLYAGVGIFLAGVCTFSRKFRLGASTLVDGVLDRLLFAGAFFCLVMALFLGYHLYA